MGKWLNCDLYLLDVKSPAQAVQTAELLSAQAGFASVVTVYADAEDYQQLRESGIRHFSVLPVCGTGDVSARMVQLVQYEIHESARGRRTAIWFEDPAVRDIFLHLFSDPVFYRNTFRALSEPALLCVTLDEAETRQTFFEGRLDAPTRKSAMKPEILAESAENLFGYFPEWFTGVSFYEPLCRRDEARLSVKRKGRLPEPDFMQPGVELHPKFYFKADVLRRLPRVCCDGTGVLRIPDSLTLSECPFCAVLPENVYQNLSFYIPEAFADRIISVPPDSGEPTLLSWLQEARTVAENFFDREDSE